MHDSANFLAESRVADTVYKDVNFSRKYMYKTVHFFWTKLLSTSKSCCFLSYFDRLSSNFRLRIITSVGKEHSRQ